jgi:hypothetical protein
VLVHSVGSNPLNSPGAVGTGGCKWVAILFSHSLLFQRAVIARRPCRDPGWGPDRFGTSAARWASFDYVDSLARAGQLEKARNTFEKMLTYANHLGLQADSLSLAMGLTTI